MAGLIGAGVPVRPRAPSPLQPKPSTTPSARSSSVWSEPALAATMFAAPAIWKGVEASTPSSQSTEPR